MARIKVAFIKDLMGQYSRDEISFSRMCELINEEASRDDKRDELIEKSVPEISDEGWKQIHDDFIAWDTDGKFNFSQKQIYEWFKERVESELAKRMNNEVTTRDLRNDDLAREERK